MLELVPPGIQFDFIGKAKLCIAVSVLVILVGIGSIVLHGGLQEGIDFSGGTLLQLRFSQPVDLRDIREASSLDISPAATYSPTHLRTQYHRR